MRLNLLIFEFLFECEIYPPPVVLLGYIKLVVLLFYSFGFNDLSISDALVAIGEEI